MICCVDRLRSPKKKKNHQWLFWTLSQLSQGERWGTPWIGHQSVRRLSCLWTVEGSWRTCTLQDPHRKAVAVARWIQPSCCGTMVLTTVLLCCLNKFVTFLTSPWTRIKISGYIFYGKVFLCYQTLVSRIGSGYVSTVTEWLSREHWVSSCSSSNVRSICTVTRLGPGGLALVSDVLGLCSITATQSSSSNALHKTYNTWY